MTCAVSALPRGFFPKPEPTSPAVGSLAPNSCGQSTIRSSRNKGVVLLTRMLYCSPRPLELAQQTAVYYGYSHMGADFGLFVRRCHSATREGLAAALTSGRYRLEPAACDHPRSLNHSQNSVSGSQNFRCHPQHKRPLADRRLSNICSALSLDANDCCSAKQ